MIWGAATETGGWPSLEKHWVRWEENTEVIRGTEYRMVMRPFPPSCGVQQSEALLLSLFKSPVGRPVKGGHLPAIDFPSLMQRFWRSMQHEGICVLIKAVGSADQCRPRPQLGLADDRLAYRGVRLVRPSLRHLKHFASLMAQDWTQTQTWESQVIWC